MPASQPEESATGAVHEIGRGFILGIPPHHQTQRPVGDSSQALIELARNAVCLLDTAASLWEAVSPLLSEENPSDLDYLQATLQIVSITISVKDCAAEAEREGPAAKKSLDTFNSILGFGKTNCAGGGSCSDALGQAAGAVMAGLGSEGESEEPELAALAQKWSRGTFESVGDSLAYHFGKHGAELAAEDMLQYLRKADAFASNLQRSRAIQMEGGTVKFIKNGRYLIKDIEGKILSFGLARD
jgi:hypothetical protein